MQIKRILQNNRCLVFLAMIPAMFGEYWRFSKNVVTYKTYTQKSKLETEISMGYHALEKGLSMPLIKINYGELKAEKLISDIKLYYSQFGDKEYLDIPLSMLNAYIVFKEKASYENIKFQEIKENYRKLCLLLNKDVTKLIKAGSYKKTKAELIESKKFNFEDFANTRFSVRNFSGEGVDIHLIEKALKIAQKSPSACNRQGYRAHIFGQEKKNIMLNIQGGSLGFGQTIDKAILITGDQNKYYTDEVHLPYVDGSLYAMSLVYALHSMGLATITLTMSRSKERIKRLYKELEIPKNEIPIILIGVGQYSESLDVSMSTRNQFDSFVTYH